MLAACRNDRVDAVRLRSGRRGRPSAAGCHAAIHGELRRPRPHDTVLSRPRGRSRPGDGPHVVHAARIACSKGHVDAARLLLERGAEIFREDIPGVTAHYAAIHGGHAAMADWLARISAAGGWTRYLSEPRYAMVALRELVSRERARREREFGGKEKLLDFLFPGDQPPPQVTKQAEPRAHIPPAEAYRRRRRAGAQPLLAAEPALPVRPHLPDELFALIVRFYSGGEPPRDEAARTAADEERSANARAKFLRIMQGGRPYFL